MVDHQSKEVVDKMSEDLKIQPALLLPKKVVDSIQPVYVVNPVPGAQSLIQIKSFNAADNIGGTIHITHSIKDTFLTGSFLSVTKDVVNTSILSSIKAVPFGGASIAFLRIKYEPVTAGSFKESLLFPFAIKLAKNSVISADNSSGLASIDLFASIQFYEVDPL